MLHTLWAFVVNHLVISIVGMIVYLGSAYFYASCVLTGIRRPVNFFKATWYHKREFAITLLVSLCGLMLLDLFVGMPVKAVRRRRQRRENQRRLEQHAEESRRLRESWTPPIVFWNEYKSVIVMLNEEGMKQAVELHKRKVRDGLLKQGSLIKPVRGGVYTRKGTKLSEQNTSGSYSGFDELVKFCSPVKREDLFVPHLDRFFEGEDAVRRLGSSWPEQLEYVYGPGMKTLPEWMPEKYREITGIEKAMAV